MSSRTLFRLSGFALIAGSILLAAGYAVSSLLLLQGPMGMYTAGSAVPAYVLRIAGATLVLLGMPALAVRIARGTRAATLGIIGLIMTFIGLATVEVGMNSIFAYVFSALASDPATQAVVNGLNANKPLGIQIAFPIGLLLEIFGPLLLGISIMRARSFSRMAGISFLLIMVTGFLSLPDTVELQVATGVVFAIVLALGFCSCGSTLWADESTPSRQEVAAESEQREPVGV